MAGRSFCWAVGLALILHAAAVPARGQWVEPPGRGWLHINVYHHATSRQFDADARRASIFAEGRAQTTSLLVSGAIGLFRGVDAWAQLPLHRLRYRDAGGARERVGPGDPRFYLRLSPTLAGLPAWPVAFRAGVKLPGGDFPVDAEIIPLGEGQRDWEAMIEVGHSFYPRPLYAMA